MSEAEVLLYLKTVEPIAQLDTEHLRSTNGCQEVGSTLNYKSKRLRLRERNGRKINYFF